MVADHLLAKSPEYENIQVQKYQNKDKSYYFPFTKHIKWRSSRYNNKIQFIAGVVCKYIFNAHDIA